MACWEECSAEFNTAVRRFYSRAMLACMMAWSVVHAWYRIRSVSITVFGLDCSVRLLMLCFYHSVVSDTACPCVCFLP